MGLGVSEADVKRHLAKSSPLRRLIEDVGPERALALRLFSDQQYGQVRSWAWVVENRASLGMKIARSQEPDPNSWEAVAAKRERDRNMQNARSEAF